MACAKNQVTESKSVNEIHNSSGEREKKAWQNEGITRHIYESK